MLIMCRPLLLKSGVQYPNETWYSYMVGQVALKERGLDIALPKDDEEAKAFELLSYETALFGAKNVDNLPRFRANHPDIAEYVSTLLVPPAIIAHVMELVGKRQAEEASSDAPTPRGEALQGQQRCALRPRGQRIGKNKCPLPTE